MRLALRKINIDNDKPINIKIKYHKKIREASLYEIWQYVYDLVCYEQLVGTFYGEMRIDDSRTPSKELQTIYNAFIKNETMLLEKIWSGGDRIKYKIVN